MHHCLRLLVMVLAAAALPGCSYTFTLPLHDPIYPAPNEAVTYTLDVHASDPIQTVRLYETADTIDAAAKKTPGAKTLIKTWTLVAAATSASLKYVKVGGYASKRLVTYTFEIVRSTGSSTTHDVVFAIRPYPVINQPAPVYVQGDPNRLLDFVLIRDERLDTGAEQAAFYSNSRNMIANAILNIDRLKLTGGGEVTLFNRAYNFYVNPATGRATSYNPPTLKPEHTKPANWAQLSFAEVKAILHDESALIDWAMYGNGPFSTRMTSPGTFRHESGHKAFTLADEYCCNGGYYAAPVLPNLWKSKSAAKNAAPSRGKQASDVQQLTDGTTKIKWWKICALSCQMRDGLSPSVKDFDTPGIQRIRYVIVDTLSSP